MSLLLLDPSGNGMKIVTVVGKVLKINLKPIDDTVAADWLMLAGADGKAISDTKQKTHN